MGKIAQGICKKDIILGQFKSIKEYRDFAESSLKEIVTAKEDKDNLDMLVGRYLF